MRTAVISNRSFLSALSKAGNHDLWQMVTFTVFWVTPALKDSIKGTAQSSDQPPLLMPPCFLFPLSLPSQAKGHSGPLAVWPGSCQSKDRRGLPVLLWRESISRLTEDWQIWQNRWTWFSQELWIMSGFSDVQWQWGSCCCLLSWEDPGEGLSPLAVCQVLFNF